MKIKLKWTITLSYAWKSGLFALTRKSFKLGATNLKIVGSVSQKRWVALMVDKGKSLQSATVICDLFYFYAVINILRSKSFYFLYYCYYLSLSLGRSLDFYYTDIPKNYCSFLLYFWIFCLFLDIFFFLRDVLFDRIVQICVLVLMINIQYFVIQITN